MSAAGLSDVGRAGVLRQQHTVGDTTGGGEGPWAGHAGQDRGRLLDGVHEPDVVEVDMAAMDGDGLAPHQAADGVDGLGERGERRGRSGADLAHPRLDTVPDARYEPPGMEAGQDGELHRRHGRVPDHGGCDAEPDGDPFGRGQHGRR